MATMEDGKCHLQGRLLLHGIPAGVIGERHITDGSVMKTVIDVENDFVQV